LRPFLRAITAKNPARAVDHVASNQGGTAIAVSSTSPSTATLTCYSNLGPQAQVFIHARHAQLDAIQTSSNS
jgi:hypothetical protein